MGDLGIFVDFYKESVIFISFSFSGYISFIDDVVAARKKTLKVYRSSLSRMVVLGSWGFRALLLDV